MADDPKLDDLDETEELCPDCGEFVDECECDHDGECDECGELLEECICDDWDPDEEEDD